MDSSLNMYFNGSLYINLDARTDRKALAEAEFHRAGLEVQRVSAIRGNPGYQTRILDGHVGCVLSHAKCVQIAKDSNWEGVLIFEDDVELRQGFPWLFTEYLSQVPPDWDMIYLGGNHWGCDLSMKDNPPLVKVSANVARTTHTLTTHAYIMRKTMYDRTLEFFTGMSDEVDVMYVKLQSEFNVYAFRPSLAWQREDISDINNTPCNYYFIKEW